MIRNKQHVVFRIKNALTLRETQKMKHFQKQRQIRLKAKTKNYYVAKNTPIDE